MKNVNLLFLSLLFSSLSLQAQTEYVLHSFEDDFENEYSDVTWESRPYEGDAFETDLTIIENPDKTGINQSDKVLWAQTQLPPTEPDGKTMPSWYRDVFLFKFDPGYPAIDPSCRYLHIMHYRTNVLSGWRLVINGENLREDSNPKANEWVDIVIDLDRLPANKKESGVYEIEFLMNVDWGGSAYPQTAFYVDNIVLSSSPAPRADNHVYFESNNILDFEDEETTNVQTSWSNNGGGNTSISTDNQDNENVNFSTKCAFYPGDGGDWWNGFRFDFKKLIQITDENKYLHVLMKWDDTEPRPALDITYRNAGSDDQLVIYSTDENGLKLTNEWQDYVFEMDPGANISVMEFKCKGAKVYLDEMLLSDSSLPRTLATTNKMDYTLTGPWSETAIKTMLEREGLTSLDLTEANVSTFNLPEGSNCLVYANSEIADRNCIVHGIAKNLVLTDEAPFNCIKEFEAQSVTYHANFSTNGYETICIPFDVQTKVWSELYSLANIKEGKAEGDKTITFALSENIESNVPYLVKWSSAIDNTLTATNAQIPVTNKLTVSTADNIFNFSGTYTPVTGEGKYIIQPNGTVVRGNSDSEVNAFQAYLNDPEGTFQGTITLFLDKGTTGVENEIVKDALQISVAGGSILIDSNSDGFVSIYTVGGSMIYAAKIYAGTTSIDNLPKGIYLINNQKVILK